MGIQLESNQIQGLSLFAICRCTSTRTNALSNPSHFCQKKRGLPALPGLQYVTLKALRAHLQHDYQRIQMTGTDFQLIQSAEDLQDHVKRSTVSSCAPLGHVDKHMGYPKVVSATY